MTLVIKMQKTLVTFGLALMLKVGVFSYSCGDKLIKTYLN